MTKDLKLEMKSKEELYWREQKEKAEDSIQTNKGNLEIAELILKHATKREAEEGLKFRKT